MNIPKWLSWPEGVDLPTPEILNESRKEMYTALSLFHNHVKYVIYIIFGLAAAILAILRFWDSGQNNSIAYVISGIILICIFPVGILSINIIKRYYEVYISALVFATRTHISVNYTDVHPWIYRTINQAQKWQNVENSLSFLKARALSMEDSFALYRWIIIILSITSFICGVLLA